MAWPKKVSECNHPGNRQKWGKWQDAATYGKQFRRRQCQDCGHYTKSANRIKP